MKLKVIDKDKVKILIEPDDIRKVSLPENITDCNDEKMKDFILTLLGEIYIQTGINFLYSKICVEVIPGVNCSFYVVITRQSVPKNVGEFDMQTADEDMYLFELHNPENIFDVSRILKNRKNLKTGESGFYKYKDRYYLTVNFPPETVSKLQFNELLSNLSEYSQKCKWNLLNEAFLCEWGELIVSDPIIKIG